MATLEAKRFSSIKDLRSYNITKYSINDIEEDPIDRDNHI